MKYRELAKMIQDAKHIIVLQADNPDGDSLGSSLALEAILDEMDKKVSLCCAVDMPAHLKYMDGWDRVQKEIPNNFDLTIIVDANTETLFEYYEANGSMAWIKSKQVVVIDHHTEASGISYATLSIVEPAVATSEILHDIAVSLQWKLPIDACTAMAISIMSDSLGLTTDGTTANSFRVMADLVERGIEIPLIDQARRELMRKEPELIPYKGQLLQRVTFDESGKIATIVIPWSEIERYSPLYNPSMLVLDDMRLVVGVEVAIAYKVYKDGKITAKIRCNYGSPVASDLSLAFGGGGHPYAAGFKISNGNKKVEEVIKEVNEKAKVLLEKLEVNQ